MAPVSSENLVELVRLHTMKEVDALRELLRRGDDAWEERLVAAHFRLNQLNPERAKPESKQAWEEAHRTYHLALVSACGMPLLLKFCGTLHDLSDRYRRLFLQTAPHDSRAHTGHQGMLDAALARNAEKACTILHAPHRTHGPQCAEGTRSAAQVACSAGPTRRASKAPRGLEACAANLLGQAVDAQCRSLGLEVKLLDQHTPALPFRPRELHHLRSRTGKRFCSEGLKARPHR